MNDAYKAYYLDRLSLPELVDAPVAETERRIATYIESALPLFTPTEILND